MKSLILILSCLLLVMPCRAANEERNAEEIEQYIARQRAAIENYYAEQIIELEQGAKSRIRLLKIADKPIYSSLAAQARVAEIVLDEARLEINWHKPQGYSKHGLEVSPKRYAAAQRRVVERKNRVLAKLAHEKAVLERQKNYALNAALPELEEKLKQDLLEPEPKRTKGVVTGIVYSADRPAAIVDGQIVHEDDVIHGVTVAKIYRDRVSFVKGGKSWGQKVRQSSEF